MTPVFLIALLLTVAVFGETTAEASLPGPFPITFTAYGNTYSITSADIGADDNGDTTVVVSGSGFEIITMRNDKLLPPLIGSFVSAGKTYDVKNLGIGTIYTLYFETATKPESITLINGDTEEEIATIKVPK
jgi:hypothetical protein